MITAHSGTNIIIDSCNPVSSKTVLMYEKVQDKVDFVLVSNDS